MKTCPTCQKRTPRFWKGLCHKCYRLSLPKDQYKKWKNNVAVKKRWEDKNKSRILVYRHAYRKTKKAMNTAKNYRLGRLYGLSIEIYDNILLAQRGVCYICKKAETKCSASGNLVSLTVDHDHKCCSGVVSCGKCVRRLLCHACNVALGLLEENPDRMRQMACYVEECNKRTESGQ